MHKAVNRNMLIKTFGFILCLAIIAAPAFTAVNTSRLLFLQSLDTANGKAANYLMARVDNTENIITYKSLELSTFYIYVSRYSQKLSLGDISAERAANIAVESLKITQKINFAGVRLCMRYEPSKSKGEGGKWLGKADFKDKTHLLHFKVDAQKGKLESYSFYEQL